MSNKNPKATIIDKNSRFRQDALDILFRAGMGFVDIIMDLWYDYKKDKKEIIWTKYI